MNEIDLTKILKDCPKGTKLYSTIYGEVEFDRIEKGDIYSVISVTNCGTNCIVTSDGRHCNSYNGECTLFPSREQRDWSKFTAPWYKKESNTIEQSQTNEHTWLHLVSDVLTWQDGIGQYLDDQRVQEFAKKLCSKYVQKLYNPSVLSNSSNTAKNEKKSTDKIEPKFKVGDWVVNKFSDSFHIDSLDKKNYQVSDGKGNYNYFPISQQDKMHLWTIQDTKDGDVLAFSNDTIVIFKDLYNSTSFHSYCHIEDGIFDFNKDEVPDWWNSKGFKPVTKEQRDLLFQKIKGAGYKWNAETKTLEKLLEVPGKFNPKTLKAFDKVLIKSDDDTTWVATLFSHIIKFHDKVTENDYLESVTEYCTSLYCIPYNDETKHLVGTKKEAPEYYRYWED